MSRHLFGIFLSSTSHDLEPHRAKVHEMVQRLEQAVIRMESFGSRSVAPLRVHRDQVQQSDALVVLVGHRYGWIPGAADGGDGEKSITWWEVLWALEAKKPVFAYLIDPETPVMEKERGLYEFRAFLENQVTLEHFTSADDVGGKVATSLANWIRDEWEQLASAEQSTPSDSSPTPARRIFLCYRRQDTQGHTGRLRDRLVRAHGKDAVFMDVDDAPYGVDFVKDIDEVLNSCAVMVVMVGQSWTTVPDKKGRRRLDQPTDLVRGEIAAALKRNIPVIGVLVEDASIPDAEDIPEEIRGLTRRNFIELTHRRWESDVQRVLKVINEFIKAAKTR